MKCNETRCKQGIASWSVLLISELFNYIACIGNGWASAWLSDIAVTYSLHVGEQFSYSNDHTLFFLTSKNNISFTEPVYMYTDDRILEA